MYRLTALALALTALSAAAGLCPSGWKLFGNMCYWSADYVVRWEDVTNICGSILTGADMVSIHDLDLNAFIAQDLLQGREAWLGARRESDSAPFRWTDGSPFDFSLWYGGDPDHDGEACASINWKYANPGDWTGHACDRSDSVVNVTYVCRVAAS